MAIPPTAKRLGVTLDPKNKKPVVINYAPILQPGEEIASFTIERSVYAIAAGAVILTGDGRDPARDNANTAIRFWPYIEEADQEDPIFDGAGVVLDFKFTITTNSSPERVDEQTYLIPWAQK